MLKVPVAGRVKTRLGQDIGMTTSAWWFRHQTKTLLRNLEDPRWDLILAVSPDRTGMNFRGWHYTLTRFPQGHGTLGDRMKRILTLHSRGPIVLIGADIPNIKKQDIRCAFEKLGTHKFVFGPAFDGGYWLVGAKRVGEMPLTLFQDVRWSTSNALEDTLKTLGTSSVGYVRQLQDIDTLADLEIFVGKAK
jgi:rSAM/selenodomain-associated transferase 1